MNSLNTKLFYDIHHAITEFGELQLWDPKCKRGLEYLKKYQLLDETIRRFNLGYTGESGNELYARLVNLGFTREELNSAGFRFDEANEDEFFKDRIVFPYKDINGLEIGIALKSVGKQQPIYKVSSATEIFECSRNPFGLEQAQNTKEDYYIICEGFMDPIILQQSGFDMAVGLLPASDSIKTPCIGNVKKVYLAFDPDNMGKTLSTHISKLLISEGIEVRCIDVFPYCDCAELIAKAGKEEFKNRIIHAKRI